MIAVSGSAWPSSAKICYVDEIGALSRKAVFAWVVYLLLSTVVAGCAAFLGGFIALYGQAVAPLGSGPRTSFERVGLGAFACTFGVLVVVGIWIAAVLRRQAATRDPALQKPLVVLVAQAMFAWVGVSVLLRLSSWFALGGRAPDGIMIGADVVAAVLGLRATIVRSASSWVTVISCAVAVAAADLASAALWALRYSESSFTGWHLSLWLSVVVWLALAGAVFTSKEAMSYLRRPSGHPQH